MKAAIAYVHPNEITTSFHDSLMALVMFDAAHDGLLCHDHGRIALRCGTDGLVAARNMVAEAFVKSDVDWLLIIDSDMGFAPDTLYQLIKVADPVERPIVGGLCFASRETHSDGMGGFRTIPRPTIYDWREVDGHMKFAGRNVFPVNQVVRCVGTGSACILIHRSVFERIAADVGPTWYDRIVGTDGSLLGEDISFCIRAGKLNIPIHVHTGVKTTHLKPRWLSEVDFWQEYMPPPATDPVDVIIPVLHRPQNVEPLMQSLRASTGLARAWFVCEEGDLLEQAAVQKAGGEVLVHSGTFAQKVNYAVDQANLLQAPWVFLSGDDVVFWPAWLDHAQHIAKEFGGKVVGTLDGPRGNARVQAGEHGTHLLIAKDYIFDTGASWDGPGTVCHEGYGHWYVDDEIVTAAKQRGVWQMAFGAVVDHIHPAFGKTRTDDVYLKGQSTAQADAALFQKRFRKYVEAAK